MKSLRLWIAAAALTALLLLPLLGFLRARAFLSGEEFQTLAARHAGSALGGVAEFAPIRWSGPAASSDTLRVRGGPQSPLRQLEASNLGASWNWRAIFSGVWHIEQITADSLSFTIGPPVGLESTSTPPEPPHSPAFLPNRFEIGPVKIRRANLDFEGAKLQDATLEIQPRQDALAFTGNGGTLAIPHWPVLGVEAFRARWTSDQLRIDSAALRHGSSGLVAASGDWPGTLQLDYSGIELSSLLTPPWRDMLNGTLSGNATIAPHHTTGRFELTQAVLRGVEWLDLLASLTGRSDLQRLRISKATGSFAVRDNAWHWSDLVVESSGLLRVEGALRVSTDKHLSGEIRLGVDPSLLRSLPGASEKIFTDSRDGFLWTPVVLGGTLDTPTENLTPRLAAATADTALEAVQPLLEAVPGRAREAVGDTINSLFDILRR
jgi:hypothetical protein